MFANAHDRSNDGLTLLMSSTDGFCSALSFTPGELGQPYTGDVPTLHRRQRSESHPANISTAATASSSASNTPLPTPTTTAQSPSLHKTGPAPPSHPSPAPIPPPAHHFSQRPTSPTRSNSTSSIATLSSAQPPTPAGTGVQNNPTPTMGHVPLVTAANPGQPNHHSFPVQTPPMTPASGGVGGHVSHSSTSSVSGSVLGKREGQSESEREDGKAREGKRRRIAPTLVSGGDTGTERSPDAGPV